jgi:hypothetical protein
MFLTKQFTWSQSAKMLNQLNSASKQFAFTSIRSFLITMHINCITCHKKQDTKRKYSKTWLAARLEDDALCVVYCKALCYRGRTSAMQAISCRGCFHILCTRMNKNSQGGRSTWCIYVGFLCIYKQKKALRAWSEDVDERNAAYRSRRKIKFPDDKWRGK